MKYCQKMHVRCLALNVSLYAFSMAILEMNKVKPSMLQRNLKEWQ